MGGAGLPGEPETLLGGDEQRHWSAPCPQGAWGSGWPRVSRLSQPPMYPSLQAGREPDTVSQIIRCSCRSVHAPGTSVPFFFFFFLVFLGPHLQYIEVPGLGGKLELQLPANTTATVTWDPSHICNLHCSSRQHQILNPLSKARDGTCILGDTGWILKPLSHNGISWLFFFFFFLIYLALCDSHNYTRK